MCIRHLQNMGHDEERFAFFMSRVWEDTPSERAYLHGENPAVARVAATQDVIQVL